MLRTQIITGERPRWSAGENTERKDGNEDQFDLDTDIAEEMLSTRGTKKLDSTGYRTNRRTRTTPRARVQDRLGESARERPSWAHAPRGNVLGDWVVPCPVVCNSQCYGATLQLAWRGVAGSA